MKDTQQRYVAITSPGLRILVACALVSSVLGWAAPPSLAQYIESDDREVVIDGFQRAYRKKDWPTAIAYAEKLETLPPVYAINRYGLACVYALNSQPDKSLEWLNKAADRKFDDIGRMKEDSDLTNVRDHPDFAEVFSRIEKNLENTHAKLLRAYERRPPLVFAPLRHNAKKPAPLIIILHGYGAYAQGVFDAWEPIARQRGALLAAPEAPTRVKGAGWSWQRRIDGEYLVRKTLADMKSKYKIDPKRTVLAGFSQGAYMSYAIATRHPDLFSGVIPICGGYLPATDAPPKARANSPLRFFFMVGEHDRVARQNRLAATDFAKAGYTVDLRIYPGVGHAFPLDPTTEFNKALDFLWVK